ncbi:putative ubie coq5 [Phaeomoniella chlamydospora]|uniref:Putative ubie coq5 n=1 Tax=Phaeomoniella chlamydospora TaxID=158046 RepID=A0A0G2GD84_PHACM|nr:putative ubie coq5 [Phaeomoniella chlamydospora]
MSEQATYAHGHHSSVVNSHARRTAQNSFAFLLPHIRPAHTILDLGCGPGTITCDIASLVPQGRVIGTDAVEDVLVQARDIASSRGLHNIKFEAVDANSLPYPDAHFDIVYCHQLLQHVQDPINILREMRRVTKPNGLVAVREADYKSFAWSPDSPGLDAWAVLYEKVARANGGEPNAGRYLLSWARKAGFGVEDVQFSWNAWCYAHEEATWWGNSWADRALYSGFAKTALEKGIVRTEENLKEISEAYKEWAKEEDGLFIIPNGEILCRVSPSDR